MITLETGTYSSLADLKELMRTFLTTKATFVNVSNDIMKLPSNEVFFELGMTIATDATGVTGSQRMALRAGLAHNGVNVTNPWGSSDNDRTALRGISTGSYWQIWNGRVYSLITERSPGIFQHLNIGNVNTYDTVAYDPVFIISSWNYDNTNYDSGSSASAVGGLMCYGNGNTYGSGFCWNGSVLQIQKLGRDRSPQFAMGISRTSTGGGDMCPYWLNINASARENSGLPVLYPIHYARTTIASSTISKIEVLGDFFGVKQFNGRQFGAGSILKYGETEFMIFPHRNQGNTNFNSYAYRIK